MFYLFQRLIKTQQRHNFLSQLYYIPTSTSLTLRMPLGASQVRLSCSSPRVSLADLGQDMSSLSVLLSLKWQLPPSVEPFVEELEPSGRLRKMTMRSSLATRAPPPGRGGASGLTPPALVVSSQLHSDKWRPAIVYKRTKVVITVVCVHRLMMMC